MVTIRTSRDYEDGVIGLGGGVLQTRLDVTSFEIGKVGKDFRLGNIGSEQIEHVFHTDAHPADAGPSTALRRIVGDAVGVVHRVDIAERNRTDEWLFNL